MGLLVCGAIHHDLNFPAIITGALSHLNQSFPQRSAIASLVLQRTVSHWFDADCGQGVQTGVAVVVLLQSGLGLEQGAQGSGARGVSLREEVHGATPGQIAPEAPSVPSVQPLPTTVYTCF